LKQRDNRDASAIEVLVVDNDELFAALLQETIESLGYPCRTAASGADALAMHEAQHADVILSDWQMPIMSGLELCKRTRRGDNEDTYTYFILLTGYSDKEHFVRGMDAGADDYYTKPIDIDELSARLTSAARVVNVYRKLAQGNEALRRAGEASFRDARVDPLTQVSNRLRMDEDMKVLWARAKRYGHRYAVAIGDIDHFKGYNDVYGHIAGDEVLRRVAHTIREQLRESDGTYRYGGEEFVALLPEQSITEAAHTMDRVRLAVERLAIPARQGVVTVCFGVAALDPTIDATPTAWLERADAALYRAKQTGRNRVEIALAQAVGAPTQSTTPASA
jgi:two-component system chemotaxis response regulator CheY